MPQITDISLYSNYSLLLLVFSLLLGLGSVVFMYRATTPPLKNTKKIFLGFLRAVALFSVIGLFFAPVVTVSTEKTEKPNIAIVVDNSESMSIEDSGVSRKDKVLNLLTPESLDMLENNYTTHYFSFDGAAKSFDRFDSDSLSFTGQGSDLSEGLAMVLEDNMGKDFSGIVLLSDGVFNRGFDPLEKVKNSSIPVFPLILGSTEEKKDILISNIQHSEITYTGKNTPITTTVKAVGFEGKTTVLQLSESGNVIESRTIQIAKDGLESSYEFSFTPEASRTHSFTAEIVALEQESVISNNSREFFIKALESKTNVLIISGTPNTDYRFLKASLESVENFSVTGVVGKGIGFYSTDIEEFRGSLASFDVFVFNDYPYYPNDGALFQEIRTQIASRTVPVLYIRGKSLTRPFITGAADLFGIRTIVPSRSEEQEIYVALTPEGLEHPVFRIYENSSDNIAIWQKLPPVFTGAETILPGTDAKIMGLIDRTKSRRMTKGVNAPIITIKNTNGNKSMFINFYAMWKWKTLEQRDSDIAGFYDTFLENSIKWLVNKEDSKKVKIQANKEFYESGEKVTITAQVYDDNFSPVNSAEVTVSVSKDGIDLDRVLTRKADGVYEAKLEILEPGEYAFTGRAAIGERELGRDSGNFAVERFNIEMQNTSVDSILLSQIAAFSNGKLLQISEFTSLPDILQAQPTIVSESFEIRIWDTVWLLGVILSLFSIEWFFRKRWGLL